jgi:hypothetical protein
MSTYPYMLVAIPSPVPGHPNGRERRGCRLDLDDGWRRSGFSWHNHDAWRRRRLALINHCFSAAVQREDPGNGCSNQKKGTVMKTHTNILLLR